MLYRTVSCVVVALSLFVALPVAAQEGAEADFHPLLNGKDLTGWQVVGTKSWSVEHGVLYCSGQGGGCLRTEQQYENFELRLDFKISKGGNSGIFIRAADKGNPAFSGMELQILDDHGRKPDTHTTMSIYAAVAPSKNMSKPADEWNSVDIICKDMHLTIIFNGEKVMDCALDDPNINTEGHPKLTERAKKGYIGLQNHGGEVWFRNIRVKTLD